ncbi:MAG: DUF87 domain-containing protein [Candidatus Marsarchaeota archaeon]|nr:DUF87 domain-containing protein [Candidatus Marsarchaeota archaeon]MCL5413533.1 DUF87 domain-containing protein [Candidatus Marsarchaeota archaeon]
MKLYYFNINAVSDSLDRKLFLDYLLNSEFMMLHDFGLGTTSIISESPEKVAQLNVSGMGIDVEEINSIGDTSGRFMRVPIAMFQNKNYKIAERRYIDDMYGVFMGSDVKMFSSFTHPRSRSITELKDNIEDKISRIEVRYSHSTGEAAIRQTSSASNDSYYGSYEKRLLSLFLDNLNDALINRGLAYNTSFMIRPDNYEVINYLKSIAVVLEQETITVKSIEDLYDHAKKADSIPLSYANASKAIGISNRIRRVINTSSVAKTMSGDIELGRYISPGISTGLQKAEINSKVLNLGTLITGLPGTGKTNASKLIVGQALRRKAYAVIISPTGEWDEFGHSNSLNVVNLGKPQININFFKCESNNISKFYENLAMLISAGSNSGPYQNSMHNCLLSAFSKIYAKTNNPEPEEAYAEIEDSVIEQHAKRTGAGVKYTKHGENIRASLEGLRQVLMKPQFAYSDSTSFKELVKSGVVFDLSELSNNIKPLIYALILNQVYNISEEFDIYGDNETRLIICLEEAQLVFNEDNESSATLDLRDRIQNFRKNGVALLMITHNINDISPNIRRLCQNKLYFRQSADVAKYAANDLIFNEADYDKIVELMKTLGHRECAVNVVEMSSHGKNIPNSSFVRIMDYRENTYGASDEHIPPESNTAIRIVSGSPDSSFRYEIHYLGERIRSGMSGQHVSIEKGLLPNKKYRLLVLGDKKKENREFQIIGGTDCEIIMQSEHKTT